MRETDQKGRALPSKSPGSPKYSDKMTLAEKIFFAAACTLASVITASVQTGFFLSFRPFGAAPELCLALSAAAGLRFGPKCGGLIGVLSGFFLDALSSSGISLAIPFYLAIGILMGFLGESDSGIELPPLPIFLIGLAAGAVISGCGTLLLAGMTYSTFNLKLILSELIVPRLISTLAFGAPIYLPVAFCAFLVRKKQGFR